METKASLKCSQRAKKCKFCSSTFQNNADYLTHIETTHKTTKINSFMCSDCGRQFHSRSELSQHTKSKCGTIKRFKCKVCDQELMSAGSLYNHTKRHLGKRSFMCRYCAKLFNTAGQLKVHERIHTQDKAYVCNVCGKGFCHRQSLITHSTLHTGIKPFQCENCGDSFSCIGNLLKHRKTHADTCGLIPLTTHRVEHPNTKIKVKINTPENTRLKIAEKKRELQEEIDLIKKELHDDSSSNGNVKMEEVPIKIEEIDVEEEIKTEGVSSSEKKDVNPVKKRVKKAADPQLDTVSKECIADATLPHNILTCSECDKILADHDSLQRHIKIHHHDSYICAKCGVNFRQKSQLIKHEQMDCNNGPTSYQCPVCEKKFTCSYTCKNHKRVHDPNKQLSCRFCTKRFHWKGQLKIHERKHTGEKPFICTLCSKRFAHRESLITHQTIHTGIKPHLCDGCGARFSCIGNLIKHRTKHATECGDWKYKTRELNTKHLL